MMLLESILQDLRYGVRMLFRNGRSTVVTVGALSIGIGLNTAVFTAYKATLGRPLDARDSDEMVNIALVRESGAMVSSFSYPDYEMYRDSVGSFSGLIAFNAMSVTLSDAGGRISERASRAESGLGRLGVLPSGAGNAEIVTVYLVSENYFEVLGVPALRGRTFESISPSEMEATPPVLISENYWQRRFAGDPAVLGKTIRLNNLAVTVVGITPRDFVGTSIGAPPFWGPLSIAPLLNNNDQWLRDRESPHYGLRGRLAPGVSIAQAQAEMSAIADHVRTLHDPDSDWAKPASIHVWPGSFFPFPVERYGALKWTVVLIVIAAGMVLAVACANVGSLQLARAQSRRHELLTRSSLGASRLRIIRQLVTETALVGLLAGAFALLWSWGMLKVLATLFAESFPLDAPSIVFDVTPDLEVFAYVLAVSLVAGMLSGLAPAMEGSRFSLSSSGRASTPSARSRRLQDLLVTTQVALSLVLLITAGMLIRSSMDTLLAPTGYDTENVIAVELEYPGASEYTAARKLALLQEIRASLAALPGVTAITSAQAPGVRRFKTGAIALDEGGNPERNSQTLLPYTYVQGNYFQAVGIPLPLGRGFSSGSGEAELSVIVSESAAKYLWPEQSPIGRNLRLGVVDEQSHPAGELVATGAVYEVVGVVRDRRIVALDAPDSRELYLPLAADQFLGRPMLVRTESDPTQATRSIHEVISSSAPGMTAASATLEDMLRQSPLFVMLSMAAAVALAVGSCGLLLTLMGIYGTVNYIVVLRTREVGIRMAIGAQKHNILGLILRESSRPVLVGLFAGMLIAAGTSHLVRRLFYGLIALDSLALAGVSVSFLAIALLAAYPPARRAMRVDPMVALRYE